MTPYTPPPAPPKRTALKVTLIVAAVLAVLCAGGVALFAFVGNAADQAATAIASQDTANRDAATPPATTAAAPKPTTTKPAAVLVEPGTYTVGEDIPAGRYKVTARADDLCYWAVSSSTGSLLDNGVGGGFPTFTVRAGQQVEIMGCPTFQRQK